MSRQGGGGTNSDELLRAAVSGDMNAYTKLFEGYRKKLYYFVYKITGSAEDVEDVIQEIFMPVYEAIQKLDSSNPNLRAYLYQAARHAAYKVVKRRECEGPILIIGDGDEDNDFFDENLGLWNGLEAIEDDFAKDDRKSLNEEAREARKEGDKQKLNELRDEFRKSFREG